MMERRIPILDHRVKTRQRAMDLILREDGSRELEFKGKGKWSIGLEDAIEQINKAIVKYENIA